MIYSPDRSEEGKVSESRFSKADVGVVVGGAGGTAGCRAGPGRLPLSLWQASGHGGTERDGPLLGAERQAEWT